MATPMASAASSTDWSGAKRPDLLDLEKVTVACADGGAEGEASATSTTAVTAAAGGWVSRTGPPFGGAKFSVFTRSSGTPIPRRTPLTASIIAGGPQRWTRRRTISGTAAVIN